jgi:polyisoprenoid-binding protein YceI
MKKTVLFTIAVLSLNTLMAQKTYYSTKAGAAYFDAGTGVEDITAINKLTTVIMDPSTGKMNFLLNIKGFEFKSQLMQDHFNENYMESDKFPTSSFKGTISNISKVNFAKDGSYPVTVTGTLEIHGVKNEVSTTGTIKIKGETVEANSEFNIQLEDYKIPVPSVVGEKLSKTVKIKINASLSKLVK